MCEKARRDGDGHAAYVQFPVHRRDFGAVDKHDGVARVGTLVLRVKPVIHLGKATKLADGPISYAREPVACPVADSCRSWRWLLVSLLDHGGGVVGADKHSLSTFAIGMGTAPDVHVVRRPKRLLKGPLKCSAPRPGLSPEHFIWGTTDFHSNPPYATGEGARQVRITVTSVLVDDRDKALAFYTDVLGS